MRVLRTMGIVLGLVLSLTHAGVAEEPDLTFFGWSDQHVKTSGDGEHLIAAIEAMNKLPGTKYPERIGGTVERPAFVLGCGDATEWPTAAARDTYEKMITKRLKFRAYDIMGNHDEGGQSPSETMKQWIVKRHGALSYTFDAGGVHFICLYSKYDESIGKPAQPISQEALDFLGKDLAKTPPEQPVIVATHLCHDAITNRDAFLDAMGKARVLAVLGGHYHKASVNIERGVPFIQFSAPAPYGQGEVTVIRISKDRIVALPYDYREKKWDLTAGKMLDAPISTVPREGATSKPAAGTRGTETAPDGRS